MKKFVSPRGFNNFVNKALNLTHMDIATIVLLLVAGLMVGFINTLAGGGSVISLSALILLGLPANVANGTNRIAILIQNIGAVGNFKRHNVLDSRKGIILSIPALVGAVIGSWIAADINEELIRKIIGIILIIMLFVMLFNPKKWIKGDEHLQQKKVGLGQIVMFFFIGIYGGFIHIGVGYALLAGIVLGAGYDLVKGNAIKVLIILLWTPLSLLVFWYHHQIVWSYGLIMGLGNFVGALIASQLAVKRGAGFVRLVVIVVIIFMSAHLLGLIDLKAWLGLL